MKQFVPVYTSIESMLTGTPIGVTVLDLPSELEIAYASIEADVFNLIDAGEVTLDPEAASGHLDKSYYNNPLWLTSDAGEIDIFAQ